MSQYWEQVVEVTVYDTWKKPIGLRGWKRDVAMLIGKCSAHGIKHVSDEFQLESFDNIGDISIWHHS